MYYAEPPRGEFDVTGILSQFKSEATYGSGYEILPRTEDDLVNREPGNFEVVGTEPGFSDGLHAYPSPTEQFLARPLGSLRAGVYVLRVRTGSGWVSRRIVKR